MLVIDECHCKTTRVEKAIVKTKKRKKFLGVEEAKEKENECVRRIVAGRRRLANLIVGFWVSAFGRQWVLVRW